MKKESAAAAAKIEEEEEEEGISSAAEVSVPFSWESKPGTPRVKFRETTPLPPPPLTAPPSYYHNLNITSRSTPTRTRSIQKYSKPKQLLSSIFQKRRSSAVTRGKTLPSSPASSSSSSSSSSNSWSSRPKSYSVPSSPMTARNFQGCYHSSSPRQSYNIKDVQDDDEEEYDEEEEEEHESTVSTILCFGSRARASSRGRCYSPFIKIVVH